MVTSIVFEELTLYQPETTPPTDSGRTPPPMASRKVYQSVSPNCVWTWRLLCMEVKSSCELHSWWYPSIDTDINIRTDIDIYGDIDRDKDKD